MASASTGLTTCDGTAGGASPSVIPIQKSLRDSADLRHLQQIIAGLSEGVILIDPDQTILWANEAALRMHGIDRLDALVEQFQAAGLAVTVRVEGDRAALAGAADLVAYRVVQEALTNAHKHGSAGHAHVLVEVGDREARIVVIGALDASSGSPALKATGRYRHEDLVDLIEKNQINMFLFPSIWPETFSYVVAELMALHVPIVAFDLGAPAERLRTYALGRLCKDISARAALDTLSAFHAERARGHAAQVA